MGLEARGTSDDFDLEFVGSARIGCTAITCVRSTGADSQAQLTDSLLEDHVWAEGDFARLESPLSTLDVISFHRVAAESRHGGVDHLTLLEPLDYVLETAGSWLMD